VNPIDEPRFEWLPEIEKARPLECGDIVNLCGRCDDSPMAAVPAQGKASFHDRAQRSIRARE